MHAVSHRKRTAQSYGSDLDPVATYNDYDYGTNRSAKVYESFSKNRMTLSAMKPQRKALNNVSTDLLLKSKIKRPLSKQQYT